MWTGIGAIGAFIVGVVALGEAVSPLPVLIVTGRVAMKLAE